MSARCYSCDVPHQYAGPIELPCATCERRPIWRLVLGPKPRTSWYAGDESPATQPRMRIAELTKVYSDLDGRPISLWSNEGYVFPSHPDECVWPGEDSNP